MIIIPARIASNRFANKVLADINGTPMVIATAKRVERLDEVAIATDSEKVLEVAKRYGFRAVMTRSDHNSGTDRINEAADILGLKEDEIVVNVQADEPFIEESVVKKVIDRVRKAKSDKEEVLMVSCYKKIPPSFADDPNHVKVVVDHKNYALYFSRSKIPYDREEHLEYFGHLGIYGFVRSNLRKFCSLPPAPLEEIEKLEQLRALYFGLKIAMVEVESESFGIDTPHDLERALKYFKDRNV